MLMIELIDKFREFDLNHDDICCANCSRLSECNVDKKSGWALFCQFCNQFEPDMVKVKENKE